MNLRCTIMLTCLAAACPAAASLTTNFSGRESALRLKSHHVETVIEGAAATTVLEQVFVNPVKTAWSGNAYR